MENGILQKVDAHIEQYQAEHHGEEPLYLLLPSDQAEALTNEVRSIHGYAPDVIVTSYRGIKIVKNEMMDVEHEIILSNDLPETGS